MKEYKVDGHISSFLPEGKEWKMVWNDEFDGTELDRSKWDFRLSMMGKRHPAWTDKGVHLDGKGNVVLSFWKKTDVRYAHSSRQAITLWISRLSPQHSVTITSNGI